MRRKGERLAERTEDRTASKKNPEWRYHSARPGRDTLSDLFEQRYEDVIERGWRKLCEKYGLTP